MWRSRDAGDGAAFWIPRARAGPCHPATGAWSWACTLCPFLSPPGLGPSHVTPLALQVSGVVALPRGPRELRCDLERLGRACALGSDSPLASPCLGWGRVPAGAPASQPVARTGGEVGQVPGARLRLRRSALRSCHGLEWDQATCGCGPGSWQVLPAGHPPPPTKGTPSPLCQAMALGGTHPYLWGWWPGGTWRGSLCGRRLWAVPVAGLSLASPSLVHVQGF